MSEPGVLQFRYQFDPIRTELDTDPDAWAERRRVYRLSAFCLFEDGIVLLAGRSMDVSGPGIEIIS